MFTIKEVRMRDPACVPQLGKNLAALFMHGICHPAPTGNLSLGKEPRSVGVALPIRANDGGFTDDQPASARRA